MLHYSLLQSLAVVWINVVGLGYAVAEQARSKRRNTYFNDADSTSHIYEHNPCDSFRGTCSKQRGWTADVHTQVSNVLQGIEGSAAAVKIVHPPRKDPIPTGEAWTTAKSLYSRACCYVGIQREKLADAILNNLVSTPVPQGFKTRLCLLPNSTLPPLVIDDKPTARAFRSSSPRSRDRNRESAAIMGKRTRQVTRYSRQPLILLRSMYTTACHHHALELVMNCLRDSALCFAGHLHQRNGCR